MTIYTVVMCQEDCGGELRGVGETEKWLQHSQDIIVFHLDYCHSILAFLFVDFHFPNLFFRGSQEGSLLSMNSHVSYLKTLQSLGDKHLISLAQSQALGICSPVFFSSPPSWFLAVYVVAVISFASLEMTCMCVCVCVCVCVLVAQSI